jgi:hypothetical protein
MVIFDRETDVGPDAYPHSPLSMSVQTLVIVWLSSRNNTSSIYQVLGPLQGRRRESFYISYSGEEFFWARRTSFYELNGIIRLRFGSRFFDFLPPLFTPNSQADSILSVSVHTKE